MNSKSEIVIRDFLPEDQDDAKNLILAGMKEHWGVIDPNLNPDLNDIRTSYADGFFLITQQDGKLIGTGALIPRSTEIAEIVRMSVATHRRRNGVGKRILQELCRRASALGFKQIILETTDTWDEAINFYKQFGFKITHYQNGEVYFALLLN